MIILAGCMTAAVIAIREKRRIQLLEAWIDLIFHIRTQIDCYLKPIGEILQGADMGLLQACMGTPTDRAPQILLERCRPYLSGDAERLLTAFVGEIGCSYREEQVKRCDFYMESLRRLSEKEREELPARLRVRTSLCVCASVGAAILLW